MLARGDASTAAVGESWSPAEREALVRDYAAHFDGRTALVTGADGFIGSHLAESLSLLGAELHLVVRPRSHGSLRHIGRLAGRATIHQVDLVDRHAVNTVVAALGRTPDPPWLFHLAAQAHVGESWRRPFETIGANVLGTLNLLQSIATSGLSIERLDIAGTSEEYGNVEACARARYRFAEDGRVIFDERSPLSPRSIYATSKLGAEFLARNFHDAYGLPTLTTRMFNNYGPRQSPCYLTGTIITQALSRHTIELGHLEPTRDFCFCTDGVRGHLSAAVHGRPGAVYCYGSGEAVSVGEWARLILEIGEEDGYWQRREIAIVPERMRPGSSDVMSLRVDHGKLTAESGWRACVPRTEGLRRTIAWYARHYPRPR